MVNEFIRNVTSSTFPKSSSASSLYLFHSLRFVPATDAPGNAQRAFDLIGIRDPITQRLVLEYLKVQFPEYFGYVNGTQKVDPPKFELDVRR